MRMKIIALADTHLELGIPDRIIEAIQGTDLVLHAGDFTSEEVHRDLSRRCKLVAVAGNGDSPELKSKLPERTELNVHGVRIGLVHEAALSRDSPGAVMLAREMDVDILVYGHLHRPVVQRAAGRLLICPGSPVVPRLSLPSAAEITVEEGRMSCRIVPLGGPVCSYLKFAESLAEACSPESLAPDSLAEDRSRE